MEVISIWLVASAPAAKPRLVSKDLVGKDPLICPGRAQRRMKITPTPPSPVEGEEYREGDIFI